MIVFTNDTLVIYAICHCPLFPVSKYPVLILTILCHQWPRDTNMSALLHQAFHFGIILTAVSGQMQIVKYYGQ